MKHLLFLAVLAVLFSCKKEGTKDSTTTDGWKITTIDNVNAPNNDISIACDGNNKIHVCYNDDDNVKYATNKSGSWNKQTLHSAVGDTMVIGYNHLAVDGSNHVHIVYATQTNEMNTKSKIYYATDKTGTLLKQEIYSVQGSISGMGIGTTTDGKVHIVYSDPDFRLKYINNLSGSWSSVQDLGSYWTGVRPRIALDSEENVYVVHEHGGEGVLFMQLINASGNPVSNDIIDGTLDSGEDIGWSPEIAIDKSDNSKYIIYYNYTGEEMMFYYNGTVAPLESSSWADGDVAIDPDGNPHILFRNGNALRYGIGDGDSFTLTSLPDVTNSRSNGITIDSDGTVYVVYNSGSEYKLKMMSK